MLYIFVIKQKNHNDLKLLVGYNLGYINNAISQSLQNKDALPPEFQKTLGDLKIPPTKEKKPKVKTKVKEITNELAEKSFENVREGL